MKTPPPKSAHGTAEFFPELQRLRQPAGVLENIPAPDRASCASDTRYRVERQNLASAS